MHLCVPRARCLPCDRMKDVGTNTVRRTDGLGSKESLLGNRSKCAQPSARSLHAVTRLPLLVHIHELLHGQHIVVQIRHNDH
jgi:hypothetical protein